MSAMKAFAIAVAAASLAALLGSAAQAAGATPATAAAPTPTVAPKTAAAPRASRRVRAAPLEASEAVPIAGGEPAVRHTVIDDNGTRIDELRVRGQLKNVTVHPKGKLPTYEVLTGSGASDLPEQGINRSSGLEGKRVWSLLRF